MVLGLAIGKLSLQANDLLLKLLHKLLTFLELVLFDIVMNFSFSQHIRHLFYVGLVVTVYLLQSR